MIRMKNLLGSVALGIWGLVLSLPALGQTIERDTTITGPRGRTIKRQVEVQRTPGGIDRSVQIQRPGEHSIGKCKFSARLWEARGGRPEVDHGLGQPGCPGRCWWALLCQQSDLA